ncbi:lysophospholipid acyltransferase family protein [Draconibacterium halophilum]|uniref:Lysophospholipid acyltransferase family protein n=1 Tax=Draconibacterium halophilum TaxID=2706887 RepID=A0A6C0RG40_9BACT|nr:lysophospholipid acyltransferase family protein [Draconibacterium halophilum]QIA09678.1 lysophospholipid acyltransferase family protein [Draconibacterium halophilum]
MVDESLRKKDKRYYEGFFKRLLNGLVVLLLKFISVLPFWAIYGIADFFYLVVRHIIGYRKKVILDNLRHAFPEKNEQEITKIMNRYYHHFCDFSLETIKLHGMSEKQMDTRLKITGLEGIRKYAEAGRSIMLLGFHYNNWEWCSSIQTKATHRLLMIVNPIRGNLALEKFIEHSRSKWGGKSVPVHKSARTAIEYMRRSEPAVLWLAADQTPAANSPFWTNFLNREAPFFTGPEKIAIKTKQPIFFLHLKKLKRGHYEAVFSQLFEDPSKVESKDILLTYIRKMEEVIRETPEYYLWSHRRWKHTRPEGIELTV